MVLLFYRTSSKLIGNLKEEARADKYKCLKNDRIMAVPCGLLRETKIFVSYVSEFENWELGKQTFHFTKTVGLSFVFSKNELNVFLFTTWWQHISIYFCNRFWATQNILSFLT